MNIDGTILPTIGDSSEDANGEYAFIGGVVGGTLTMVLIVNLIFLIIMIVLKRNQLKGKRNGSVLSIVINIEL